MELETRIEHLSDEIAQVKTEMKQVMLEMRQLLDKFEEIHVQVSQPSTFRVQPYEKGRGRGEISGSGIGRSIVGNNSPKMTPNIPRSKRDCGGLNLSEQDLALLLSRLQLDRDGAHRDSNSGFSLGEFANAIEVGSDSSGTNQVSNDEAESITMSLGDLAQVLKGSNIGSTTVMGGKNKNTLQSRGSSQSRRAPLTSPGSKTSTRPSGYIRKDEVSLDVNLMSIW